MKNDKELENALAELINSMLDAKDFVISEAPEVIQQLITFKIIESSFMIIISGLLPFLAYRSFSKWSNQELDNDGHWSFLKVVSFVMLLMTSLLFITRITLRGLLLLKLFFAEKVFLLEYAAGLIK